MGKFRKSKDNVYTLFDKAANLIRVYKPSGKVQKVLEDLAKQTLKNLANMYLAKTISKKKISKEVANHAKKVVKIIGKDIKKEGI